MKLEGEGFESSSVRLGELQSDIRKLQADMVEMKRQKDAMWNRIDGREGMARELEQIKLEAVKSSAALDSKFGEKVGSLEKAMEQVKRDEMTREYHQKMRIAQLTWKVSLVIGGILFVLNIITKNIDLRDILLGGGHDVVASRKR